MYLNKVSLVQSLTEQLSNMAAQQQQQNVFAATIARRMVNTLAEHILLQRIPGTWVNPESIFFLGLRKKELQISNKYFFWWARLKNEMH